MTISETDLLVDSPSICEPRLVFELIDEKIKETIPLLMENWNTKLTLIAFISSLTAAFSLGSFFLIKRLLGFSKQKAKKDKVLLKELLEAFELDIPAELQDNDSTVIEPFKGP